MEENSNLEQNNVNNKENFDLKYIKKQWIYKSIIMFIIFGGIICICSSSLTYYFTIKNKNDKFISSTYKVKENTKATSAKNAMNDLTTVLESFAEIVDDKYIGEIDKKELINQTVKGFINGIGDEYSEYMTSNEWEEYQETALGNYSGVGIIMTKGENGYVLVTNVIKDGSAEKAGIKQGDYIIGVNGESIYQEELSEVSSKVKGEAGTDVTLNILRNETEQLEFNLKRQNIRVYHVEGKMLEDDIGYIYFNTFDTGCAEEFEQEMDKLVDQGAKNIVLDLRYNTGGDVEQALKILDLFLDKGQVELITQSANGPKITTSSLNNKKYSFNKVVILTNKYTASASEILTGALLDNGIAKTVGTKTYGKGVMQSVFPLLDGSILKLTTQEYHTPNDTKIHGVGINPDYEVENTKEDGEIDAQLEKAKEVLKGE